MNELIDTIKLLWPVATYCLGLWIGGWKKPPARMAYEDREDQLYHGARGCRSNDAFIRIDAVLEHDARNGWIEEETG